MKFDYQQTLKLIKGGLLDHTATWQTYLAGNPPWLSTATVLTAPLVVGNIVLSLIFSRLTGGFYSYGYGSNFFVALIVGLVMAALGLALGAYIFSFLAGTFGGKRSFDRAFAALSLTSIPAMVAGVIAALVPSVGLLIMLAGGVISLVFLYQILPLALEVPDEKRTLHFVVSLIALFVVNMILATLLGGGGMMSRGAGMRDFGGSSASRTGSGMFGEMERQSRLMEAAQADTYDPPGNGKLDDDQVEDLIKVLAKTAALQQQYADKMNKLGEEVQNKEQASVTDVARVYAGIGSGLGANNAEMEVVKTGGGNWAEHSWVKEQLRTAMIQQGEGSEAIKHNYSLYQEYQAELEEVL